MTAREIIRAIDDLLHEWAEDGDTTTAEYVCVRIDYMLADYLKRPMVAEADDGGPA